MAQRDVSYLMLAAFDEEDAYSDFLDACAAKDIPCPTFEVWRKQRLAEAELKLGPAESVETVATRARESRMLKTPPRG